MPQCEPMQINKGATPAHRGRTLHCTIVPSKTPTHTLETLDHSNCTQHHRNHGAMLGEKLS
eukprot:m.3485 g.3485  ORF g.3485 m.3485 type:complete len:61 (+) comp2370_c0_seq1:227-409(+)